MQIKIGNDWVYDTETYIGNKVVRNSKGEIQYLKPIFSLQVNTIKAKETRYDSEKRNDICKVKMIDYSDELVPLGVVRNSINMQILAFQDRLEKLNASKENIVL